MRPKTLTDGMEISSGLPPTVDQSFISEAGGAAAFLEKNRTPAAAYLVLSALFPPEKDEARAVVPSQDQIYEMGASAVAAEFRRDAYA